MEVRSVGQGGPVNQEIYKSDIKKVEEVKDNKEKTQEYSKKDLDKALGKLNKFLEDDGAYAEYRVHDKLGDIMIKIIDSKTKEVIMEVPPKKVLDMIAKMCEMAGVFDRKA